MVIKLADINGPAKKRELHIDWTRRISEEFYEQVLKESMPLMDFILYDLQFLNLRMLRLLICLFY